MSPPFSRPDSAIGFDRPSRPMNKLSLSNFRRPSPAPSTPTSTTPIPLVQDGSYLEMLSLKLSEAVSKALAQPTGPAAAPEQLGGRRPIPQGRGYALGALIASWVSYSFLLILHISTPHSFISSELGATNTNPHLYRAILRSLHRPLSVLVNNLSAHLLPLLTSSAFYSPPAPTVQSPHPNTTQVHALAIATFAGELLEVFDDLGLGLDGDVRGDGLKLIREGLVSLVNRVIGPLVTGIRNELMPLIEALETPNVNHGAKSVATAKSSVVYHPAIVTLQSVMPIYAKVLARYTTSTASQTTLTTFLISLTWRALVALSHRPFLPASPPPSPKLSLMTMKKRGSPTTTPNNTPPAGRFTIKLPPSRPPSPPVPPVLPTAADDARALYDMFCMFPRPSATKQSTRLAREAVDEAFNGLKALPALIDAVHALSPRKLHFQSGPDTGLTHDLGVLTTELPTLISLPVLLNASEGAATTSVASMLGLSEDEYRKGCLSGFGRAEECATAVAQRMLDSLCTGSHDGAVVCKWLELEIVETGR